MGAMLLLLLVHSCTTDTPEFTRHFHIHNNRPHAHPDAPRRHPAQPNRAQLVRRGAAPADGQGEGHWGHAHFGGDVADTQGFVLRMCLYWVCGCGCLPPLTHRAGLTAYLSDPITHTSPSLCFSGVGARAGPLRLAVGRGRGRRGHGGHPRGGLALPGPLPRLPPGRC